MDQAKTLEQLENEAWPLPNYDSSLVQRCHALRKKPVAEFTTEDLRIMIGQEIGLPFLLPIAIDVLQRDVFAGGDLYEGDLLAAVLRVNWHFYESRPDVKEAVRLLARKAESRISEAACSEDLERLLTQFLKKP